MSALGLPRVVGYGATAFCVAAVLGDAAGFWSVTHGWGQLVIAAAMLAALAGLALARRRKKSAP